MMKLEYKIEFNTPAFIGDASQESAWRTPPFKALMRHWWRFLWVAKNSNDLHNTMNMWECESQLFGSSKRQSQVRIRLSPWRSENSAIDSGSYDYLRYGRENCTGIDAGKPATLTIFVPDQQHEQIISCMSLIHQYGTIGGRSRNGWGSIHLTSQQNEIKIFKEQQGRLDITSDWKEAIKHGWPHAIGLDENGPLIWQSGKLSSWQTTMKHLADLRKELNRESGTKRGFLSLPAKMNIPKYETSRMPNALRFKVRSQSDQNNAKLCTACIYFVPAIPKELFEKYEPNVLSTWELIFGHLDKKYKRSQPDSRQR